MASFWLLCGTDVSIGWRGVPAAADRHRQIGSHVNGAHVFPKTPKVEDHTHVPHASQGAESLHPSPHLL